MLDDIRSASTSRLREVRLYLESLAIEDRRRPRRSSTAFTVGKGLFFVHLYGVFEFTVTQTVQRAIQLINAAAPPIRDLKPILFSVALDAECQAVADVGRNRAWPKRWDLFNKIVASDPVVISDTVFPADSSNLKYEQLQSVWTSFCISSPVLPDAAARGRLHEITDNRNAIAHGRESPATVGSRYTVTDLKGRLRDIDGLCEHVIQTFEAYLQAQHYIG